MNESAFDIYRYHDYREALRERLANLKSVMGREFSAGKMAEHCRVQRTYLSSVLHLRAHLSSDQLHYAGEYLQLTAKENKFIFTLHDYQKTEVVARKRVLAQELDAFRAATSDPTQQLEKIFVDDKADLYTAYFTDPELQIICFFLEIKEYRDDLSKISEVLLLPLVRVEQAVKKLMELRLVYLYEGQLKVRSASETPFLKKGSALFPAFHAIAKLHAHHRLATLASEDKTCASLFITCDKKTSQQLRKKISNLIVEISAIVGASSEEPSEVHQFSFDLFPWTEPNR